MPATQPEISEVIDVRSSEVGTAVGASRLLARTATLEVRRLILASGHQIPTHQAPGEITVHCLEGRIAFMATGATRELGAGQMIVLATGVPHSVVSLEDSTVLVTKVIPANPSAS
jgi:quercetin dioxygenase-like cupin family protein